MRIVFLGTPDFAATILQGLIDADLTPVAVVSQPDRPQGRKQITVKTPVKAVAEANDIPVLQPTKIKTKSFETKLAAYEADFIVTAAYGRIIPDNILALAKVDALNVHGSLLPKYRGASPVQAALINAEDVTGVTILRMTSELDAGPIFKTSEYSIPGDMRSDELMDALAALGAEILPETLREIYSGNLTPLEQDHEKASEVGLIDKSMGQIDWNNSARIIEGLVRGLYPWPGAFTYLDGKRFKIHAAKAYPLNQASEDISQIENYDDLDNGTVVSIANKSIWVKTGDGVLQLKEIQKDNSKAMSTNQVYHNYQILEDKFTNTEES